MNTLDHLLSGAISSNSLPVQGNWFNVRYRPNLNTGEILNLGVGFVDSNSKCYCQLLGNFKGLVCIYGPEIERHVRFLLTVIERSIDAGQLTSPSENVIYSEQKFATGTSVNSILNELFNTTVTLAHVHDDKVVEEKIHVAVDDAFVRNEVFNLIRNRARLDADRIIAQDSRFIVEKDSAKHVLDIPLQGAGRLGSLVSALYSSKNTVEIHLLRATIDLETARRSRRDDQVGLFVLRPDFNNSRIPENILSQIDNVIDSVDWKLRKQNIKFDVQDNSSKVATQIMEWADIRAA